MSPCTQPTHCVGASKQPVGQAKGQAKARLEGLEQNPLTLMVFCQYRVGTS